MGYVSSRAATSTTMLPPLSVMQQQLTWLLLRAAGSRAYSPSCGGAIPRYAARSRSARVEAVASSSNSLWTTCTSVRPHHSPPHRMQTISSS